MFKEVPLEKWRCPGIFRSIEFLPCPECGDEVEFYPQDMVMQCLTCGHELSRQSSSCLSHCPAKQSSCYRNMVRQHAVRELEDGGGDAAPRSPSHGDED